MISLEAVREQLCELLKRRFPDARFVISERRSVILEMRIILKPEIFMEIYINGLTGKKSFALIENEKRVWGYDNYKYWHHHPTENPAGHVPCNEPSLKNIIDEVEIILAK